MSILRGKDNLMRSVIQILTFPLLLNKMDEGEGLLEITATDPRG